MPEHPFEPTARAALAELTPEPTIGELLEVVDDGDGVTTLRFASTLGGYPGWRWTASIAQIENAAPTVLETELTPADGALLAPDWVPWSDRLADYKAAQEAAEAEAAVADDSDDDDLDEDDLDEDDLLDSDVLHGGDLDGVDIDEDDEER